MPPLRTGQVRNQLSGLCDEAVLKFSQRPRQSRRLLCQQLAAGSGQGAGYSMPVSPVLGAEDTGHSG